MGRLLLLVLWHLVSPLNPDYIPYTQVSSSMLAISVMCFSSRTLRFPVLLTWISATCTQLGTDTVIFLQSLLKVENPQIVLAHGKMDATKIIPEHAPQAFTWKQHKPLYPQNFVFAVPPIKIRPSCCQPTNLSGMSLGCWRIVHDAWSKWWGLERVAQTLSGR